MAFSDLAERKAELVRKALDGSVFIAEMSADPIVTLTTGASAALTPLPTGYLDFGWLTTDGISAGRSTTSSDIDAFGSSQPVRSDITSDVTTMTFTGQETKLATIKMETGADDAALTPDATTGEVSIAKPERPPSKYWRVFSLVVDTDDAGDEIYIARFLPRAKVTAFGDKVYTSGDTAIGTNITVTSFVDSELGYTDVMYYGGPGWKNLLLEMGFDVTP